MKASELKHLLDLCQQQVVDIRKQPTQLVSGFGNPDANVLLVGEAPGAKEVEQGKPFVGQAGKNLDLFLETLDLKREAIYITNVVKYRPYRINPKTGRKCNRPPNKKEIELFMPYLHNEIEVIEPKTIVTLGNVALRAVSSRFHLNIGEEHGQLLTLSLTSRTYELFPLYHPASIIYNRSLYDAYYNDLKILKQLIHQ